MRIQSNPEQQDAAKNLTREGYVCFRLRRFRPGDGDYNQLDEATTDRPWSENWTWDIVRKCDYATDADRWFRCQTESARVWYVFRGQATLRAAK